MLRRTLFDGALAELGLTPIEGFKGLFAKAFVGGQWIVVVPKKWNGSSWAVMDAKVFWNGQWHGTSGTVS